MNSSFTSSATRSHFQTAARVFLTCLIISLVSCATLELTGAFKRTELAAADMLFQLRPWFCWSDKSLSKLNVSRIWSYHQQHEIPRTIWSWDYTLSWLIEDNHPLPRYKFVIFNHLAEDEPPQEAIASHPWMRPLLRNPLSRRAIAEIISYLAHAGVKLIILDNDLSQYDPDDSRLAQAIYAASKGEAGARPTPVLLATRFDIRYSAGLIQDAPNAPAGILKELDEIDPLSNPKQQFAGTLSFAADDDQVIRSFAPWSISPQDDREPSLILKAAQLLDPAGAAAAGLEHDSANLVGIDFVAPVNTKTYPVRPFWYLLDPQKRQDMLRDNSDDVTLKDAVVILGDGLRDLYPTSVGGATGGELMSSSELLAQSIDTVGRRAVLRHLSPPQKYLFLSMICVAGSLVVALLRVCTMALARGKADIFWPSAIIKAESGKQASLRQQLNRACAELAVYSAMVVAIIVLAFLLFAWGHIICPMVVPMVALAAGVTAANIAEREAFRVAGAKARLSASIKALELQEIAHQTELRLQRSQMEAAQLEADRQQRKEFIRCLNHDLRAPISVLNWTLCKLKREGLHSLTAPSRVQSLERISERMTNLLAQLVFSQEYEIDGGQKEQSHWKLWDLTAAISHCVELDQPLAEMRACTIELDLPNERLPVLAARGDLERIVANILRNALTHNPHGTKVKIAASRRRSEIRLSISDNGRGIPPHLIPQLFDDGFTTLSRIERNEGLGLAIVKKLLCKYDATISVDSVEGKGTTFDICFPLIDDETNNTDTKDRLATGVQNGLCQKLSS